MRRRASLCLSLASGLALSCSTPIVTPPLPSPNLADSFLVFDQPTDASMLGQSFDPGGAPASTGCYTFAAGPVTRAQDVLQYSWDRRTGDTLALGIAKVLGFGAATSRIARGTLRLDSAVVMIARNLRPTGTCRDKVGLFPKHAAISTLYGVRGYSLVMYDAASNRIGLDSLVRIPGVDLKANDTRTRNDSIIVRFSGLRWLGYHLTGFERTDDSVVAWRTDSRLLPVGGDEIDFVDGQYRLRLYDLRRSGNVPVYEVVIRPSSPPGSPARRDTVEAYEAFPLTSAAEEDLTGAYYEARIVPQDPPTNQVSMRYRPTGSMECVFRRQAQLTQAIEFGRRTAARTRHC
jgi:hypothetical protein